MEQKISQELKKYKEKFDFIHKEIGELQWKKATMYSNRNSVTFNEIQSTNKQLENYKENMKHLLSDVEAYIESCYDSKFEDNK